MENKSRWSFKGTEGVNSTRTPVARNELETDVLEMRLLKTLDKVWFDGAEWPKWPNAEGPATAANGLRPYVLDGSYVGVHVATPSLQDYGVHAFTGRRNRSGSGETEFHELNLWFQYVSGLQQLAVSDKPPARLPPGYWPIIYSFHERYWMLAEACAGILHTRIDFMPSSKRRVAEMIKTMNFLIDPRLPSQMEIARSSLNQASQSWWAWWTGRRIASFPTVPTDDQIKVAREQLKERLDKIARWAALIGGVSGRRPPRAMLAAFLEPMATAPCSKQSDRITVFAMLSYVFEHVYGSGLGPMEALRKYDREDDKLYKAWLCMSNGSVLVPDGFTSTQVAQLERNYGYEVFDLETATILHVKVGARFSMPVRLPGRGFMGSMSITPWKPLFLRALWRCRGLVQEVDTTPGSARADRVEDGTYTRFLKQEAFQMRMNYLEDFETFITGLQKWYLPLVSSDLPWCWDKPTRILVVPVVDMRQLREMKPEWEDDNSPRVLRVHMTEDGIFPRVHAGIDKTYDLSQQVTIWQFAFWIPEALLGTSNRSRRFHQQTAGEGGSTYLDESSDSEEEFDDTHIITAEPPSSQRVLPSHQPEQPELITARICFLASPWGVHTPMGPEDIAQLQKGVPSGIKVRGGEQLSFDTYVDGPRRNPVVPGQPLPKDNWSDVAMITEAPVHTPKILHGLPASCDNLYSEKWTGEEENTTESKQGWLGVNFRKFDGFDTALLWSPGVQWM